MSSRGAFPSVLLRETRKLEAPLSSSLKSRSLRRVVALQEEEEVYVPGHGASAQSTLPGFKALSPEDRLAAYGAGGNPPAIDRVVDVFWHENH
jgi:hypothetical protein